LSLNTEMPQRMLNAAAAFYIAAARCRGTVHTGTTSYETHAPPIVCYAFSIELYLKLILLITTGKKARGHKLVKVYDKLSDRTRRIVVTNWKFPGDPEHLRNLVEEASEIFVQWRYPYEHDFLVASPDELHDIALALHCAVNAIKPELISCYGDARAVEALLAGE
jgi:hypothetical protein